MGESLRFATYNVRGMRDQQKRDKIYKYIREKNFDIALLQEVHSTHEDEGFWRSQWGGKAYFSHSTSQARGVAIMIAKNVKVKIDESKNITSEDGRLLKISMDHEGEKFSIINIYAPNTDEPTFFVKLGDIVQQCKEDKIIIGGDFNLVLDIMKDKKGGI